MTGYLLMNADTFGNEFAFVGGLVLLASIALIVIVTVDWIVQKLKKND